MNHIRYHDICIFPNLIPYSFCQDLIRQFHVGFTLGEVIEGVVSSDDVEALKAEKFLVSKDIHLYDHERWDKYSIDLHKKYLIPAVEEYLSNYSHVLLEESAISPKSCIMSLYERGKGKFAPHQDSVAGLSPQRSLTVITYLNSVLDGGATHFFNQDYNIQPCQGMVAIFPSNFVYSHEGTMPISNDKYITVSFASVDVGVGDKYK